MTQDNWLENVPLDTYFCNKKKHICGHFMGDSRKENLKNVFQGRNENGKSQYLIHYYSCKNVQSASGILFPFFNFEILQAYSRIQGKIKRLLSTKRNANILPLLCLFFF